MHYYLMYMYNNRKLLNIFIIIKLFQIEKTIYRIYWKN